jgi:hypothetical protein
MMYLMGFPVQLVTLLECFPNCTGMGMNILISQMGGMFADCAGTCNKPVHPNENILRSSSGQKCVKHLPPNIPSLIQPAKCTKLVGGNQPPHCCSINCNLSGQQCTQLEVVTASAVTTGSCKNLIPF